MPKCSFFSFDLNFQFELFGVKVASFKANLSCVAYASTTGLFRGNWLIHTSKFGPAKSCRQILTGRCLQADARSQMLAGRYTAVVVFVYRSTVLYYRICNLPNSTARNFLQAKINQIAAFRSPLHEVFYIFFFLFCIRALQVLRRRCISIWDSLRFA